MRPSARQQSTRGGNSNFGQHFIRKELAVSNIDDAPIPTQENQALSDATRNYVWQAMLDGVRYVRYYEALQQRYNRRHQIFRFTLGLAGVCTALPLLPVFPKHCFLGLRPCCCRPSDLGVCS